MTHPPTALLLEFHGTRLVLEVEHGAGVDGALRFLGTHLAIEPLPAAAEGARPPLATLRIAARRTACPMPPPGTPWEDVYVRKSASEFFTIPARRARADGREYLECVKTGTRFVFDRSARTIDISLGSGGGMDFVELVRDLVLKDQENAGTVVLHAGAAYREGAAVLVVGAKGAGKSTVLLELVERFGYRILSGDKTLLHELPDGSIRAVGWPDYPHLGYGTIVKYPGLKEIAGIEDGYRPAEGHAFSPVGKFAVDPFRFRDRFPGAPCGVRAAVSAILHPSIGPGDRTVLEAVADAAPARAAVLEANVESAFEGAGSGWHGYMDDLRSAQVERRARIIASLSGVPAWRLSGPGDLTAEHLPPTLLASGG